MNEQFRPFRRSQVWLGEPKDASAYRDEGARISERLRMLDADELFRLAADASVDDRTRWQATLKLPRQDVQRLADMLIQRSNDFWWVTVVNLCPPSKTPATLDAMRTQLSSPDRGCRHRAMQLLSRLGDDSIASNVYQMLASDEKIERLVAISCLAARDSDESKRILRDYISCESNPLSTRVDAAKRLLRMGELQYVPFLERTAREDQSESAYHAACGIQHHHDKTEAFRLFSHILARPDHTAAAITVMHVTSLMGQHQLGFELEGLEKARRWLSSEIEDARTRR